MTGRFDTAFWRLGCALALSLAGCAAPVQNGGVAVLPGASERFILAMRMGYLGGFDREMVPGQVRQALLEDQLPGGAGRSGRAGDWVLENGHVLATITAIDGTARGGRLVDLALKPRGEDELEPSGLLALGQPVVYDTLKTGFDDPTSAAYVEVSARIDRRSEGGPLFTVSTRYDAAPGLRGVLVHTHVKLEDGAFDPNEARPLLEERLSARGAHTVSVQASGEHGASLGGEGGFLLRPIDLAGRVVAQGDRLGYVVDAAAAPPRGDGLVFSRLVSPLDRPDSAALAVAIARAKGDPVGDVEVRLASRGVGTLRGDLSFVAEDGARYDVCDRWAHGADSHFDASLPAGRYTVWFQGKRLSGGGQSIVVEGDRLAWIDVPVSAAAAAPVASGCVRPASL